MAPQTLEQPAIKKPPEETPAGRPPGKIKKQDGLPPDRNRRRMIWGLLGGYLGINFLMFLRFFFPRVAI